MIEKVADRIRKSKKLVVLTGAGISKESGIPTFRGEDGLWNKFKPEELATPWAFQRDPKLVWEWYNWRRGLMLDKKPNEGHLLIAKLEKMVPEFWLITQNIDGLHQMAGSKKVIELHGNIWRERCVSCSFKRTNRGLVEEIPPKCPECGSLLRPDVVWFGEALPEDALNVAIEQSSTCDTMLVVGTSCVVQPAASLPVIARNSGAFLVEVNPDTTPITGISDVSLRITAVEFAKALQQYL
ncbi:NAD-dependent deacetylase [Thermosulfidibacter takaii ABI70S6]|uniref:NAD-dependent protein deacylase n=1 Tax=Thermosulfidibacter takaii (strain DSM 17441 / JCM 13301 / NBRC 103674 / ABI70S6) TaxID=1298851 RepID=A0A0S3QU28_THET7|nr:NAD-dependent deacylase [Thermosulfidibacter takaii]BAT71832.1 NAD-dependent deacetylase [Thermosulfidibacter takaii ABI70S6]